MDHRKKSHHSRHHSKKSASSRYRSRRQGASPQRGAGGSEKSSGGFLSAQHADQSNSLELDRQRYLQWKQEYKEWCEKYFNSYVSHFHQLPPSLLNLNPTPPAQWGDKEGNRNYSHVNAESRHRVHDRCTDRTEDRSPLSQSSSDSRSTPSQSSSDSRSSLSHSSNDSRSPPSQWSSGGRSASSEPRSYQHRCSQKYKRRPITPTEGSKNAEPQLRTKDGKQLITQNLENLSTVKSKQRSKRKDGEGRGEKSTSPDAADSMDEYKRDQRRHSTGPDTCKDGTLLQEKAAASDDLEPVRPPVKPDKHLDKDHERKHRQRSLEMEKGAGRGRYSDSRQDAERKPKEKPSKGRDRVKTDRYRSPGGSDASDSRSEKTQKRRGEDLERSSAEPQSSKCLKTTEVPHTCKSENQNPKAEKKKESKTRPLTESIWEGGAYLKSQKKISINISLNGKRKDEPADKTEESTGKTKEEMLTTNNGMEEKFKREGAEVNEKRDFSRDQGGEAQVKPDEREANPMWEKATTGNHKGLMREETAGQRKEEREETDFDLWHCALGDEEEEESKNQFKEQSRLKVDNKEKMTNHEVIMGGKEDDGGGQELPTWTPKEELMGEDKLKMEKEDTMSKSHPDGPNAVDDGR